MKDTEPLDFMIYGVVVVFMAAAVLAPIVFR
jgi:type II secretory pathway component PulF